MDWMNTEPAKVKKVKGLL